MVLALCELGVAQFVFVCVHLLESLLNFGCSNAQGRHRPV